jgi:phospholipase/carboxylesterase
MPEWARLRARELVVGGALPDDVLPLIVVLHGRAGRADRFVRRFAGLGVPARVVALEAPLRAKGTGFAWLSRPACHAQRDQIAAELSRAAAAVALEVRVLREQRPTTGAPVLVGYSQGAMVALAVAVREPSAVGQVIAAAGYLPNELALGLSSGRWRPRVRMVHGQTDAVVPHGHAQATVADLRAAGWDVELHTIRHGHHFDRVGWDQVLVELRHAVAGAEEAAGPRSVDALGGPSTLGSRSPSCMTARSTPCDP